MAAAVDVAVLAQDVENMKTVLNSKIGANDDIMVSVTNQLATHQETGRVLLNAKRERQLYKNGHH